MMTEDCLRSLQKGAKLIFRGSTVTLLDVATYRGQMVVWTEEINGPLHQNLWVELELPPKPPKLPSERDKLIRSWGRDGRGAHLVVHDSEIKCAFRIVDDEAHFKSGFLTYNKLMFLPDEAWETQKKHLIEKKSVLIADEISRAMDYMVPRKFFCSNIDVRGRAELDEWVRLRRAASERCGQLSFYDQVIKKSGPMSHEDRSIMWLAYREQWLACAVRGIMQVYQLLYPDRWE